VLRLVLIATLLLVAMWALLAFLARRLPPGSAKDLATVLAPCATTARRLRRDPRVRAASEDRSRHRLAPDAVSHRLVDVF
jgi:hypothetical protein